MKRRPVRHYLAPAYPTAAELGPVPELLRTALPTGFRRVEAALPGVVVLLLAASTPACQPAAHPTPDANPSTPTSSAAAAPVVAVPAPSSAPETLPVAPPGPLAPGVPDAMVVAPLFEHGEGRGATGCVVVAPPVFLSEQEALSIVREELARHGIVLGSSSLTLDDVRVAEQQTRYGQDPSGQLAPRTAPVDGTHRPLELDAVALDQHVAVEMVSRESYFAQGGARTGTTVQSYDMKGVAASLGQALSQSREARLYVGVFYDPVHTIDLRKLGAAASGATDRRALYEAEQAKQREASIAELRAQVRDFASWLRGKAVL